MDNLKKKKSDAKLIALKQEHEARYIRKITESQLAKLELQSGEYVWGNGYNGKKFMDIRCSKKNLIRICKALLKCLKHD